MSAELQECDTVRGMSLNSFTASALFERTFDEGMRQQIFADLRNVAEHTAAAHGAKAVTDIYESEGNPATVNDPALVDRMLPSLQRVGKTREETATLAAERTARESLAREHAELQTKHSTLQAQHHFGFKAYKHGKAGVEAKMSAL